MPMKLSKSAVLAATTAVAALAAGTVSMQPASAAPTADPSPLVTSTKQIPATSSLARSAISALTSTSLLSDVTASVTNAFQDSTGATHVRLQRSYRGLPVLGGDVVVHRAASGRLLGITGGAQQAMSLSTVPAITAEQAGRGMTDVVGRPALVVDAVQQSPTLAWKLTTGGVQQDGTPSRLEHYVDARTGKTLRTEQTIETIDGDGDSLYLGNVPLDLSQSGSSYTMKSASRGGTYTEDVKNKTDSTLCSIFGSGCATGTVYTSPDTHFGTGSNTSRETAGVDAQRGSDLTWDYYKSTFGRNGIFGTGKGSYNRVHYGQDYVNAFWDGEKMTYGDGDGQQYGPLVSVDVTGHEMSHGVTENTAGLTYSGESGGLNEATSDIFGTMVEFYAGDAKDPGDYLIGEQFDATHQGLRRMDDPASDGASLNCESADAKNVDVHYSSGIGNHFFYLLAEGSGAKTINGVAHSSSTCNGSTVSGIGRDAAARIWYRALTVYFTSNTNYAKARTATLSAAQDLYGSTSAQYRAVGAAWSAVSVS